MGYITCLKKKNTEEKWLSPPPPTTSSPLSLSSWTSWPSYKNPKKVSFPVENYDNDYNSGSWFTTSSNDDSDSLLIESDDESLEEIVHRLTTEDRLLCKPSMKSNSLLEESKAKLPFKGSSMIVVESDNSYMDFKASMSEMVVAKGLKNKEGLQELVEWYLKVNGENKHGVIMEAFVDLMLENSSS